METMSASPELPGLAILVLCIALVVLASTILWRHQTVRLLRVVAGLLVVVAVLLYGYVPGEHTNRPAPLPASALVYTLVLSSLGCSQHRRPGEQSERCLSAQRCDRVAALTAGFVRSRSTT